MAGQELGYFNREQRLIEDLKSIVGDKFLGDDCAYVNGGLLLTTDTLLEGTHFLLELSTLFDIGWKAMATNLSGIAAMAGQPRFALSALTVPASMSRRHFRELNRGIADCARLFDVTVVGGDITSGPLLSITITIIGKTHEYGYLTRAGAKPGDVIVVTGQFGLSSAALAMLLGSLPKQPPGVGERLRGGCGTLAPLDVTSKGIKQARLAYPISMNRQFRPVPRLPESWQFAKRTGRKGALMDASDGLADALAQIARASKVGMQVELTEVPINVETEQIARSLQRDPMEFALYGGEDYELVGCLAKSVWDTWNTEAGKNQLPFKKIGEVTNSGRIELLNRGQPGPKLDLEKCFQHLAKAD